jgi:hypothetical protein
VPLHADPTERVDRGTRCDLGDAQPTRRQLMRLLAQGVEEAL